MQAVMQASVQGAMQAATHASVMASTASVEVFLQYPETQNPAALLLQGFAFT